VSIILAAALLSLFKVFKGKFVAARRLSFAMGRRGLVDERLAAIHPQNKTPATGRSRVGTATGGVQFWAASILDSVTDVWFSCLRHGCLPPFYAAYVRSSFRAREGDWQSWRNRRSGDGTHEKVVTLCRELFQRWEWLHSEVGFCRES